jgi:hypothetical protein
MTGRARETILVVCNPSPMPLADFIPLRDSRMMDASALQCLLTGEKTVLRSGVIDLTLPPRSIRLFRSLDQGQHAGYTMFKRADG